MITSQPTMIPPSGKFDEALQLVLDENHHFIHLFAFILPIDAEAAKSFRQLNFSCKCTIHRLSTDFCDSDKHELAD